MDFITTVAGILTKATLSCLTRLICLLLSKVPKGKAAYVRMPLSLSCTHCQLTSSFLISKPSEPSSKADLSPVSLHSPLIQKVGPTGRQQGFSCTENFKTAFLSLIQLCLYKNMTMLAMIILGVWRYRQHCQ